MQNSIFLYNCNLTCADFSIPIIAKRLGVTWVPLGYIMGRVGPSVLALGSDSSVPDLGSIWSRPCACNPFLQSLAPYTIRLLASEYFILSVFLCITGDYHCVGLYILTTSSKYYPTKLRTYQTDGSVAEFHRCRHGFPYQVLCCHCVTLPIQGGILLGRRRSAPVIPSTEVTGVILRIAYAAVRCRLASLPLFGRQTFRCAALEVAKRPSHTATIYAWPDEILRAAYRSDTHFCFDSWHGSRKMCHGYLHDWRGGCTFVLPREQYLSRNMLESKWPRNHGSYFSLLY